MATTAYETEISNAQSRRAETLARNLGSARAGVQLDPPPRIWTPQHNCKETLSYIIF